MLKRFFQITLIVMLTSCSGHSPEKVRSEAQKAKRELVGELKKVKKAADIEENFSTFQSLFFRLASLMIEGEKLKSGQLSLSGEEEEVARQLQAEMARVLRYSGAKKALVLAQEQGLKELQAYIDQKEKEWERR